MKYSLLGSALAGGAMGAGRIALAADETEALPTPMEFSVNKNGLGQGKIGKLSVSRILLGGNLLTHFTHSRDLKYVYDLCAHYNTDDKIMETMSLAEENGVNTLVIHTKPEAMVTLARYPQRKPRENAVHHLPHNAGGQGPLGIRHGGEEVAGHGHGGGVPVGRDRGPACGGGQVRRHGRGRGDWTQARHAVRCGRA